MDWLVDTTEAGKADALQLLGDHLQRHAGQPESVRPALDEVAPRLDAALASGATQSRLRLDWTRARPTLEVAAVSDGEVVDGTALLSVDLPVERRVQEVFTAGPPPTPLVDVDPHRDGAGSVAVALLAARHAHPAVTPPQSASLAGAILAQASMGLRESLSAERAAGLIAELHGALGSDAVATVSDDEVVEVSIGRCPFGPGVTGAPSLCHVTAGLVGQVAARVHGSSTVVLDQTMALGDPRCHLHVRLGAEEPGEDVRGESHQWPAVATAAVDPAPHLDLSLSLPRESGSVPVVRRLAAQALRAFGVEREDIDDVQLAITEACANVVEHATASDTYEVKVELASDRCAITVVDQGRGFDATTQPKIPPPDSESGRGLVLMQALVDNVAFRSQPQAGAVVHMVKTLRFERDHPLRRRTADRRD